MENHRPRGREKHVAGPGKTVHKRGNGLGTGPVGGGGADRERPSNGGARGPGGKGGAVKLIVVLLALLLGGGGGLTAFLGGQSAPQAPSTAQQQPGQSGGADWTQLLAGLGGGSVSSGWDSPANTGRLDSTVAKAAREKYTKPLDRKSTRLNSSHMA